MLGKDSKNSIKLELNLNLGTFQNFVYIPFVNYGQYLQNTFSSRWQAEFFTKSIVECASAI